MQGNQGAPFNKQHKDLGYGRVLFRVADIVQVERLEYQQRDECSILPKAVTNIELLVRTRRRLPEAPTKQPCYSCGLL